MPKCFYFIRANLFHTLLLFKYAYIHEILYWPTTYVEQKLDALYGWWKVTHQDLCWATKDDNLHTTNSWDQSSFWWWFSTETGHRFLPLSVVLIRFRRLQDLLVHTTSTYGICMSLLLTVLTLVDLTRTRRYSWSAGVLGLVRLPPEIYLICYSTSGSPVFKVQISISKNLLPSLLHSLIPFNSVKAPQTRILIILLEHVAGLVYVS